MNISRKSFVRPVVVAVLAVGLAGCTCLTSAEPAGDGATSPVAETPAPGPDVAANQALAADDDDEDVVEPAPTPDVDDNQAAQDESGRASAVPLINDWSQPFYDEYVERDPLDRPADPTPLVDLLPGSSQLRVADTQLGVESQQLLESGDVGSAVLIAQAALLGSTQLVNDGILEPFASTTAATCSFCIYRLEAAYAVHDEQAELPSPWEITLEAGAEAKELSGPEHLLVEFTGQDQGLVLRIDDFPVMVDLPGEGKFLVEMLYAQGQWWVLEMFGPGATSQPSSP